MSLVPDVDRSTAPGDRFAARCRELNLPLWRFGAAGELLLEPDAPGDLLAFLRSPSIRTAIESAARAALAADVPAETDLFPGCRLVPLIDSEGSSRTGVSIGLVLSAGKATSPEFIRYCKSAGLEPAGFRAVLDCAFVEIRPGLPAYRGGAALEPRGPFARPPRRPHARPVQRQASASV